MKIILQRVKEASVEVDGEMVSEIGVGYLLLVGFDREDHNGLLQPMLDKVLALKLFPDDRGRFFYSVEEIVGSLLIVSQFTLSADLKKGKKPSFSKAMNAKEAKGLYNAFVNLAHSRYPQTGSGIFGANMQVYLKNDGPVTITLDSHELFPSL